MNQPTDMILKSADYFTPNNHLPWVKRNLVQATIRFFIGNFCLLFEAYLERNETPRQEKAGADGS